MSNVIKVLIVEDSAAAQLLLLHILQSDPQIQVIGTTNTGARALELMQRNKPDLVLMDVHLPGIDGYETSRRIMETQPVPIVICSATVDPTEVAGTFRAMEAGALAAVAKPVGPGHPDYDHMAKKLLETVRLMSEVKVVKRWHRKTFAIGPTPTPDIDSRFGSRSPVKIVAIGTSTGGPPVLQTILAGLRRDLPVPVLIVQHIAVGFLPGLKDWLTQTTGFPVHIAAHDEELLPGRAYIAPDDYHMGVSKYNRIVLSKQPSENGVRPSVSHLFRSVAAVYKSGAIGILLTGMGKDGAEQLKILKEVGATTIAQNEESSIVFGMPREAIRREGAMFILAPEKMPLLINEVVMAASENQA